MIIAIDFDGTCVTHEFPAIGKDIGAIPVLRELVDEGHKLILHTMRSGRPLDEAIHWLVGNGVELYGVNENPSQHTWTTSPKIYASIYIDDAALGIPLVCPKFGRPYVDWQAVRRLLIEAGALPPY